MTPSLFPITHLDFDPIEHDYIAEARKKIFQAYYMDIEETVLAYMAAGVSINNLKIRPPEISVIDGSIYFNSAVAIVRWVPAQTNHKE